MALWLLESSCLHAVSVIKPIPLTIFNERLNQINSFCSVSYFFIMYILKAWNEILKALICRVCQTFETHLLIL